MRKNVNIWLRAKMHKLVFSSLEALFTLEGGFGLETATPLQRGICRLIEGVPLEDLAEDDNIRLALGIPEEESWRLAGLDKPKEILLLAGIRSGKSLLAAALAVWWSQTCKLDGLGSGEVARISVVSLTKDLARVVYSHLEGNILQSPVLRELLLENPTADSLMLKHPSGRPVEIKIVAGARAGASLVARWCAGVCFDEAPRMIGAEDGVVNIEHAQTAVRGRLLPGAQMVSIGSPWAPYGPIYEMVQAHWGKPDSKVCVFKAPGPTMNPVWWTPARIKALKEKDEMAYRTDVLADFADAEESLYPMSLIEECMALQGNVEFNPGADYVAAMDPATRGNAWTLVVITRSGDKKHVVLARDWKGSKLNPLKPRDVLRDIAEILADYGLDSCITDQYAGDALKDIAYEIGLHLLVEDWTAKSKVQAFTTLQTEMSDGRVGLPKNHMLSKDLQLIRKRVTNSGISIELIRTPDGRHCDFGPPLAKCVTKFVEDEKELPPLPGTKEHAIFIGKELERQALSEFREQQSKPWWDQAP